MSQHTVPTLPPPSGPRVPEPEKPFRHWLDVQTRFTDIDMLGHINNNVYLTFMDLAKLRYFADMAGRPVEAADLHLVVVNINCDFIAPAYLDEQLRVWTTIVRVGNRSITLEQRIVNADSGETKCLARTVMAGFDPATATGAPLDRHWLELAEAYEQRPL